MTQIRLGPTRNQIALKRAILEMTSTCNLFCQHCSRDSYPMKYKGEMTDEEWFSVVNDLYDYGVDMLVLGGGEPLLRKKRVRGIIDIGFRRSRITRITTNGLLLTSELAEFFADHATFVSYGMDGFDQDAYEAFRGRNGAYRKIRNAIDLALKFEILDVLAVTATKINLDQVPKVIDFCAEIGVTCVVSKYVPTGRDNFDRLLLSPKERQSVVELVGQKRIEHPHIQITTTREPLEAVVFGTGAMDVPGCIAGSGWCLVTALGDVYPCPYFPLVVGNVRERPFGYVWERSSSLKSLRDRSQLQGQCGACKHREICGGCRALAYSTTGGDYLAQDPQCWSFEPMDISGENSTLLAQSPTATRVAIPNP